METIVKIKYSFYNIKHCGIECFEKIDALKSFWNNDNGCFVGLDALWFHTIGSCWVYHSYIFICCLYLFD